MLTTKDLSQIKTIVEEVVEQKLDQKLDEKLKPIHKKLNILRGDLNTTIHFFDNEIVDHKHRLEHVESHLQLPSTPPL